MKFKQMALKIFSVLLTVTMLVTVMPVGIMATDNVTSGITGDCTWTLDGTVLTISGNGEMGNHSPFFGSGSPWGTDITKVIVEEGVTHLGISAFSSCMNLSEVSLPSTLEDMGYSTFAGCIALKEIGIPKSVCTIGVSVFQTCWELTDIWFESSSADFDIYIDTSGNDYMLNAAYHYGSCIKNTDDYTHLYDAGQCIYCGRVDIVNFEIDDITIIENGYGTDYGSFFYYNIYPVYARATLSDGTVKQIGPDGLCINDTWYYIETNAYFMQESEPWTVGNTYTVTATLKGVSTTFDVTIVPSPVVSLKIWDIALKEYTQGYDNGTFYQYDIYNYNADVILDDGTVVEIRDSSGFGYNGRWYRIETNAYKMQWENAWTVDNVYTVTGTLMGVSDTFKVKILGFTTATRLDISDISIIEGSNMISDGGVTFYDISSSINAEIKFNDGSSASIGGDMSFAVDGTPYYIQTDAFQLQQSESWTAGNTYTVTAVFMGADTMFDVTIVPRPFESIEFDDISIIEGTQGYDNGQFYQYDIYSYSGKITLKDGTVKEFSDTSGITIDGVWHNFQTNCYDIQYMNPWTVGNTYTVWAEVMGIGSNFNVTIVPSPVKSVEIQDVSIVEGDGGYHNGSFFYYSEPNISATVTFEDGTVEEFINGMYYDNKWYSVNTNMSDMQWNENWTVGNTYTVNGSFMGASTTFNVTIVPSPVEEITFKDLVLYEGVDNSFGSYFVTPVLTEVRMKDGSNAEILGNGNIIVYDNVNYSVSNNSSDMQYMDSWIAGNTYTVTGTLLGVSSEFNVTILENPIKDIELVKMPDKVEYLMGDILDLKGAKIRVNYTDGSYEDIFVEETYNDSYGRVIKLKKINETVHFDLTYDFSAPGDQMAYVEIAGRSCAIPVLVKRNTIDSITLRENEDKSLVITVHTDEGDVYDMKLIDLPHCYNFSEDESEYQASIFTDKGQFNARIYVKEGSFSIALPRDIHDMNYSIRSNSIPSSQWFEIVNGQSFGTLYYIGVFRNSNTYIDYSLFGEGVNAHNIDAVIELAGDQSGLFLDESKILEINSYIGYYRYACEDIRAAVKSCFGIEEIDITLSEYYDSETDTYKYLYRSAGGWTTAWPRDIKYFDGLWVADAAVATTEGEVSYHQITFNDDLQIVSFYVNKDQSVISEITSSVYTVSGEYISKIAIGTTVAQFLAGLNEGENCKVYNGDAVVSDSVLVGTGMTVKLMDGDNVIAEYTIVVTGDVNGDGKLNAKDLIILKTHLKSVKVLTGAYALAADVDGSKTVNALDALRVKAKLVNLDDIIPQ